ncbi:hypothetical protein, partial [Bacteroides caecimuris]|uniref:hypothetical protein n=1 Tax=Bacteroides caecimuris TaxID=1796613 RepID=UPI002573BE4B
PPNQPEASLSLSVNPTTLRNKPKPSPLIIAPSSLALYPATPHPPTPPTANGKSANNPTTTTSTTNNPAPSSQCSATYFRDTHCKIDLPTFDF